MKEVTSLQTLQALKECRSVMSNSMPVNQTSQKKQAKTQFIKY